jgi:hypothetical protein
MIFLLSPALTGNSGAMMHMEDRLSNGHVSRDLAGILPPLRLPSPAHGQERGKRAC